MTKTEWYPAGVKPMRVGVYERMITANDTGIVKMFHHSFAKWDGKCWRTGGGSVAFANGMRVSSVYQDAGFKWRGLAKPESR